MEREIIFRGKRLDNGEWVEGPLLSFEAGQINPNRSFILPFASSVSVSLGAYTFGGFVEVDPETVGQYTGLPDKNGKKIFEGDIIHYDYEPGNGFWNAVQDSIIEWRPHGLYMDGIMGTNKYSCLCGYICSIPWSSDIVEVIGNRWDNPELLEVKE